MRIQTLIPLLFFAGSCLAQTSTAEQIDHQVWESFKKAYADPDGALFVSIHTEDVLRITPDHIREGANYLDRMQQGMGSPNWSPKTIDFVFEHRVHQEDIAYEVGYYKVHYLDSGEAHYGRFHVVLRKIDGTWKIAQDWDSDNINGHDVGKADFERLKN